MAWCEQIGQECPVPRNLEKLKEGKLSVDNADQDDEDFSVEPELVEHMVPLIEYLGRNGSCEGIDTDAGRTDNEVFVSCENSNKSKIDFISTQFGLYLCSELRSGETPVVVK